MLWLGLAQGLTGRNGKLEFKIKKKNKKKQTNIKKKNKNKNKIGI